MSEAEAAIAACKTSVSEYLSSHSTVPPDTTAAGCSTLTTQYVASGASWDGTNTITATSQNTGAQPAECVLTLRGTISGADITGWTGRFSGCSSRYVPSTFR
jgi:type IV pilus assembly protein PilA